ncbi:uncharacterized protein LOC124255103 [Haliotis rubra]|uniref:uncharacterized protein LOC124255103 n=1 Tax=Haliotis rubra TaxID=36100 RepID=UPI001EE513AC|nr:uncharacterized protein LOC124255103 [Haliotis rubra]
MQGGIFMLVILLPLLCLLAVYILRDRLCSCMRDILRVVQTRASLMYINMKKKSKSEYCEQNFINKRSVYTQSGTGQFSLMGEHVYVEIIDHPIYTEAYDRPACTPPSTLPPSLSASNMYLTSLASDITIDQMQWSADEGSGEDSGQCGREAQGEITKEDQGRVSKGQGHACKEGQDHISKEGQGQGNFREERRGCILGDEVLRVKDQGQLTESLNSTLSTGQYVSHDAILRYNKGIVTSLGVGKGGQNVVQLHDTPPGRFRDGGSPDSTLGDKGQHKEGDLLNDRITSECSTKQSTSDVGNCETVKSCSQMSSPCTESDTLQYLCPNCGHRPIFHQHGRVTHR